MERIVNKARSFKAAADWDIRQNVTMTPQERMKAALELKRRAFPQPWKDVRECHRNG